MVSDQEIFPEKEVQFLRGKSAFFSAIVHGMDHDENVGGEFIAGLRIVFFDFRKRSELKAVLDGQWVEVKDFFKNEPGFVGGGALQVDPKEQVRVFEDGWEEAHLEISRMEFALGGECE